MNSVTSPFRKMQLWIVEHFFLPKKVPVLMNHNIWKNRTFWFITTGTYLFVIWKDYAFCEEKSVQLFRVAFFQRDFLQNVIWAESLHTSIQTDTYYKLNFLNRNLTSIKFSWPGPSLKLISTTFESDFIASEWHFRLKKTFLQSLLWFCHYLWSFLIHVLSLDSCHLTAN